MIRVNERPATVPNYPINWRTQTVTSKDTTYTAYTYRYSTDAHIPYEFTVTRNDDGTITLKSQNKSATGDGLRIDRYTDSFGLVDLRVFTNESYAFDPCIWRVHPDLAEHIAAMFHTLETHYNA
jgi:hypothetical protein